MHEQLRKGLKGFPAKAESMLANPDPIEPSQNICAICRETVENVDSVLLHKSGTSCDTRLHLDCFQPLIKSGKIHLQCPACLCTIDESIARDFGSVSKILAASTWTDCVKLTFDTAHKYAWTRDFYFDAFEQYMAKYANQYNVSKEKLLLVLDALKMDFNDPKDSGKIVIILGMLSKLFNLDQIIPADNLRWISKLARVPEILLEMDPAPDNRDELIRAVCTFFKGKRFVTIDLWNLAVADSAEILDLFLEHVTPGCFRDGVTGADIALEANDLKLVKKLMAIDEKSVIESLKKVSKDHEYECEDVETCRFLLSLGIEADTLFRMGIPFEEKRDLTVELLEKGAWPLNFLIDQNSAGFRKMKDYLRNSTFGLYIYEAVSLCLVLFGVLYFPERTQWLYEMYGSAKLTPQIFNENIDLVSNERIYRQVSETVKSIIQGSWASFPLMEADLSFHPNSYIELYKYEICKNIPILSPEELQAAEGKYSKVLGVLSALSIPIICKSEGYLDALIRRKDTGAVSSYLERNLLNPAQYQQAISTASSVGCSEIARMLTNLN